MAVCETCKQHDGREPHPCPYRADINDDMTPCNCCEECTTNCADDI